MSGPLGANSNTILITDDGAPAEACWCMARTKEEYRLRGQLYFIGSPESMDSASVPPPWGSKDWGFWENARQQVWRSLSTDEQTRFNGKSRAGDAGDSEMMDDGKCGYRNFGLLLLDVDSVEHTVMGEDLLPELKMRYHVVVPKRTYGRITGLHWQVEGTRFE
ncbi:hypothetical protein HK097_003136 [Rhizophlyctis rosea]|uniref:Uncharacterized protein n=1 Tax=Rhizophlyctis rosea TaxID=64517 RepID=A0AAD5SGJ5_9FUNG|nr:hypothetical protein HK097_003136 [Rhizophlyctis rosea]